MEIHFITPHGVYRLEYYSMQQTLEEICLVNRIPVSALSFYGKTLLETHAPIIGIHRSLEELAGHYQCVYIRPDRNIDYQSLCQKPINHRSSPLPVSEYSFPSQDASEVSHFEMNEKDCKNYVATSVGDFLKEHVHVDRSARIVLGVSGGGDSNTLIEAFLTSQIVTPQQILAVMMLGIPDWDKGKQRAESICQSHGVELKFVEQEEVNRLLGRKSNNDWVEDFERVFPDADLEVIGTLGIRLSLMSVARSVGAQSIVTGLNLEDILAECFLSTMQGLLPPPFPVRIIDNMPVWYPLYKIPKKILDGCHPRFSLANYMDRYPSKMLARAHIYYLAQMLNTNLPGSEFDLLNGFQKLSRANSNYSQFDETLGYSVTEQIPQDLKNTWLMFTQM